LPYYDGATPKVAASGVESSPLERGKQMVRQPKRKPSSSWSQLLAVLVVLAALATAVLLKLQGESLAPVLTATLTVSAVLARKR
jgi:hypothetical protein